MARNVWQISWLEINVRKKGVLFSEHTIAYDSMIYFTFRNEHFCSSVMHTIYRIYTVA